MYRSYALVGNNLLGTTNSDGQTVADGCAWGSGPRYHGVDIQVSAVRGKASQTPLARALSDATANYGSTPTLLDEFGDNQAFEVCAATRGQIPETCYLFAYRNAAQPTATSVTVAVADYRSVLSQSTLRATAQSLMRSLLQQLA